jgi:hypothetical protein
MKANDKYKIFKKTLHLFSWKVLVQGSIVSVYFLKESYEETRYQKLKYKIFVLAYKRLRHTYLP